MSNHSKTKFVNSVLTENASSVIKTLASQNVSNDDNNSSRSALSASSLANSITTTANVVLNANTLYHNEQLHATQYEDILWARLSGHNIHKGKLFFTDFRILFLEGSSRELFSIPYGNIFRIEKIGSQSTSSEGSYGMEIFCKDVRRVFLAMKKVGKVRKHICEDLNSRAFWRKNSNSPWPTYASEYKDCLTSTALGDVEFKRGWNIYRRIAEFERMQLPYNSNGPWHLDSLTNEKYEFCDTYPCILVYPQKFKPDLSAGYLDNDSLIFRVRDFRSKGRIPVLCWYNKRNHATIVRCSQPMVGLSNRVCEEDRDFLRSIADCNPNQGCALLIIDARPKINARANMTKGGGYETYSEHKFEFLNIPNIHVMRESLKKLEDMLYPFVKDNKTFFLDLDSSGWLWYIKQLLEGASKVAATVSYQNTSVVVHCSDGWDRTSQLTSLSMLMLDGYYRTMEGFMVLIEKEWLSFGHKFETRIGHGDDRYNDNDRSPIFLQFIDAVYQFYCQANASFEFNEWFLITILDHLYSCHFGNFLCNTERERLEFRIFEHTISLWTYILANKEDFTNPFYEKTSKDEVIIPHSSIRMMKLWSNYYCRYCLNFHSTMPDQIIRWKQLQVSKQKLIDDIANLKENIKTKSQLNNKCTNSLIVDIDKLSLDNNIFTNTLSHLDSVIMQSEFGVLPDLDKDFSCQDETLFPNEVAYDGNREEIDDTLKINSSDEDL